MSDQYYIPNSSSIGAIWFSTIPPAVEAGNQQPYPFVVSISASDTNPHVIDLYAQYSGSQPYQKPQNKWSHLVPQWRFLDLSGNQIDSITTTDTEITIDVPISMTERVVYYAPPVHEKKLEISFTPITGAFDNNSFFVSGASQEVAPYYLSAWRTGVGNNLTGGYADALPVEVGSIMIYLSGYYDEQTGYVFLTSTDIYNNKFNVNIDIDVHWNSISSVKTGDVSGQASFYYVDDYATDTCMPVVLWATMSVSGLPLYSESHNGLLNYESYANSKIIAYLPYSVNTYQPSRLKISRNGLEPLSSSIYWVDRNVPAVITVHGSNLIGDFCNFDRYDSILFNYPSSNSLGYQMGTITASIATLPASSQVWLDIDTNVSGSYFLHDNVKGFLVGGFVRDIVTPSVTTLNTYITAAAKVSYDTIPMDTTFIWVPDPENNILYKIYYPCISSTRIDQITSWLEEQPAIYKSSFATPYITGMSDVMSLTGFGGIYGMAVDPCYNLWCTDPEMDRLYKFNSAGTLLSTISLDSGSTPAGIALDSQGNMWVTLFDSVSVLKFNKYGTLLTAINAGGNDVFPIDPDFKPVLAEPDQDDNVWVTYTNPLCAYLKKYDNDGNQLMSVSLPLCSNPMDILIDYDNNPWVSMTMNDGAPYFKGTVKKFDSSTGNLLLTLSATHPSYLTMDTTGNIWYVNGFSNVNRYNTTTSAVSTWTIGTMVSSDIPFNVSEVLFHTALEGICCDSSDRIWVLHSYDNKAYLIMNDAIGTVLTFPRTPHTWINLSSVESISATYSKSVQAFGDWSGARWFQKYGVFQNQSVTETITGQSSLFNVESFDGYDLRKFNESWDTTTQMRNYALVPRMYENYNLFEKYLGSMVGGLETSANSIGRLLYEKIANFVPNHSDIDTCEIPSVYSTAQMLDVPVDDYNFNYPAELQRLMNIVSIPHKKLWGERCKCVFNFVLKNGRCSVCGHVHPTNLGEGIDTTTYQVTANVPFVAQYKFNRDLYEVINPISSYSSIYDAASGYLVNQPFDYCYFEYIPDPCNVQIEGVINWGDEYTTLQENLSSLEDWYDQGEAVEKMLNYILHKGLDL